MIHLVTGGSGSGKSEYAENWLTGRNKKDGTYIYIATMQPYTEETMKKIERHHRLRAGKESGNPSGVHIESGGQ